MSIQKQLPVLANNYITNLADFGEENNNSKALYPLAKYDAIVDIGGCKKLLRIQIKGTGTDTVSFVGGYRSGKQISRVAPSRSYKYTEKDCDLIIGIDTNNGECYIIPIADIENWSKSRSFKNLHSYRENWKILIDLAKNKD